MPGILQEHQADHHATHEHGDQQSPANHQHFLPLLPWRRPAEANFPQQVDQ